MEFSPEVRRRLFVRLWLLLAAILVAIAALVYRAPLLLVLIGCVAAVANLIMAIIQRRTARKIGWAIVAPVMFIYFYIGAGGLIHTRDWAIAAMIGIVAMAVSLDLDGPKEVIQNKIIEHKRRP